MPPVSGVRSNHLTTTQLLFGYRRITTNWGFYDLTASSTVVFHTATLATALYRVVWDLCKCPSGSSSGSYFPATAFPFTQPLLLWPTAWLSQMGRITAIPLGVKLAISATTRFSVWVSL